MQVYVGNLVSGLVAEDALRQLFNSTMRAAFPDKLVMNLDPVVSVSLHSEGRYAFVELRTPEMATAALQLSNQVPLLIPPRQAGHAYHLWPGYASAGAHCKLPCCAWLRLIPGPCMVCGELPADSSCPT